MSLSWIRESTPYWDGPKSRIIGAAPLGAFSLPPLEIGQIVPGQWWRVEMLNAVMGYGWMDVVWGEGEILLAVAPNAQQCGVGSFILERLEQEAAAQGLRYVQNLVSLDHPQRGEVIAWLRGRGFAPSTDDGRLVRRVEPAVSAARRAA